MRNLKRALSLALASVMLLGMMVVGTGASYADVTSKHNQEAIEVMQAVGVMSGDDKGNFNPDQKVTRGEMAVVMANLLNLNVKDFIGAKTPFTDVPEWAVPYVAACYADGITAGISATQYGFNYEVTTAQAALMMMKALGYFQLAKDFGSDWQVATVKQGSKINLFDGIAAGASTAMTRNEVAQIALNTLKATKVETDGTNTTVTLPGGIVIDSGDTKYVEVTNANSKYAAIDNTKDGDKYYVQLGEDLFDGDLKLTKSTSDVFGRPAVKWTYEKDTVGTYAEEADATYTAKVKVKDIYADLGLSENKTASTLTNGANPSSQAISKNDSTEIGAQGQLTEVYYDSDKGTVEIVFIDTYVGKVAAVYSNVDDPYVTVTALSAGAQNGEFETTGFKKDDIVLYTYADGEVQSLALAEKLADQKVTAYTGANNAATKLTANGTEYKAAAKVKYADNLVADSSYDLYLDANGNVIYAKLYEGGVGNYAYILECGKRDGVYTGDDEYYAKLLFADGTMKSVKTDKDYTSDGKKIITYTINDDEEYVLTAKSAAAAGDTIKLIPGTSLVDLTTGTDFYANSSTIFVVAETDGKDTTYKAYTGIANAPKIGTSSAGAAVTSIVSYGEGTVADYVFIEVNAGVISSDSDDMIFVKGANKTAADKVTAGSTEYYVYTAYVNGEKTELKVLTSATDAVNTLKNNAFLKSVTYNSKGYVTSVAAYTTSGDITVLNGTDGTRAESNGTIGIKYTGTAWYTYADDVVVYIVDGSDVKVGSIASVNDDSNDAYVAIVDSGEVTALAIVKNGVKTPTISGLNNQTVTLSGGTVNAILDVTVGEKEGTTSYKWTTTGGTLSADNTEDSSVTFTQPGVYTVTLTVKNVLEDGSSSSTTASATITVNPQA